MLAIHDKNGVLKSLYPDSQYKNLKAWIDTQNYKQFAQRALVTPEGRTAFNNYFQDALNTPEGQRLRAQMAQLEQLYRALPAPEAAAAAEPVPPIGPGMQQKIAQQSQALNQAQQRLAGMPSAESAGRVEERFQRTTQSPEQAAGQALYESAAGRGGFSGGGLMGYAKRRAAFGLIAGYGLRNPAALIIAGPVFGYDALWRMAMRSPAAAAKWYKLASQFAKPGGLQTAARGMVSFLSALTTDELKNTQLLGASPDLSEPHEQSGAGINPAP